MNNIIVNKNIGFRHRMSIKGMLDNILKDNKSPYEWHTVKAGAIMDKSIKRCIGLILDEEISKELFYFIEDKIPTLWIVLEEDNFDTNMKITGIIEDCLEFDSVEMEYLFFDESENEEIMEQLAMNNIGARRIRKNGKQNAT
ncbi:MAG: hypothetical protein ACRCXT_11935, partial [Paraclostridium sp.]